MKNKISVENHKFIEKIMFSCYRIKNENSIDRPFARYIPRLLRIF